MKRAVGLGELLVSGDASDVLVIYALGSCLGVAVHDPVARVGGLLHAVLPSAGIDRPLAAVRPCMFVDTGVPELISECLRAGARRERLVLRVAGGASLPAARSSGCDRLEIGKRNLLALEEVLRTIELGLHARDVGGSLPRTLWIEVGSGSVGLKVNGHVRVL